MENEGSYQRSIIATGFYIAYQITRVVVSPNSFLYLILIICDYLVSPNGHIQVYVNAPGCNTSVEIEEACNVGIPETTINQSLSIHPNPFTTSTTIEYELTKVSSVQFTVYNVMGEVVYKSIANVLQSGPHQVSWSPGPMPAGMYYGVLRSEEGVSVVKLIKK